MPYTNTYKHRTLYFKSTLTFLGPAKFWKCLSADPTKTRNSCVFIIRECCSILYVGLQHVVPPTNTKIKPLLFPTQAGTQTLISTEHHISSHRWVHLSARSPFLLRDKIGTFFLFFIIREWGSTLYVELACTAPPTNTNFRLTFLLTRLQEALYEDLSV